MERAREIAHDPPLGIEPMDQLALHTHPRLRSHRSALLVDERRGSAGRFRPIRSTASNSIANPLNPTLEHRVISEKQQVQEHRPMGERLTAGWGSR